MKHRVLAALLLVLAAPAFAATHYRWAVKTGADPSAAIVHATATMSVAELSALDRPTRISAEDRAAPVERTIYTVSGKLLMYRREEDGDFHVVIQDERTEATLVVEIPDPAAVALRSPWRTQIESARAAFFRQFQPTSSRRDGDRRHITMVGVGFWDNRHGAVGAAYNGIELHPVLGYSCP